MDINSKNNIAGVFLIMSKIIVFGGTGWVGHYIVLDLAAHGHEVVVASRGQREENYAVNPVGVRRIVVDKSSEEQMQKLFEEKFDIVIDTVPTPESIALVFKYAGKLRHYLHCSSTGGYTPLPFIPCDETARFHGEAGKGWSNKAVCDAEVMRLFNVYGFPATVIRPCYITGGGDKLPIDNLGGRREEFIPEVLEEKVLEVADNGLALLQPIHVEDLARSFRLAIENRASIGERYNICLDHALAVKDYLALTAEALGKRCNLEFVPLEELLVRHPENPRGLNFFAKHMCFSIEKARREIGYVPEHSVEETIVETARLCAKRFV